MPSPSPARTAGASVVLILTLTLGVAHGTSSPVRAQSAVLEVSGAVVRPLSLSPADLRGLPRTRVTVEQDDRAVTYEGVLVAAILGRAGVPLGSELRGDAVSTYVVAHAADGYRALFSVAELDPAFTNSTIMVADTVDGKPLFDYQGPLRIVAPDDTRGARSVRRLTRLEVVRLSQ